MSCGWDWELVFDGGSRGNPGLGYGSYRLRPRGGPWGAPVRLEYGDRVTNNEAEYKSLIAAMRHLADSLEDPERTRLHVLGDSQLVLRQLTGEWRVRAANLRPHFAAARAQADRFKEVTYTWQRRAESVELLGH